MDRGRKNSLSPKVSLVTAKGRGKAASGIAPMGIGSIGDTGGLTRLLLALIPKVTTGEIDYHILGAISNATGKIIAVKNLEFRLAAHQGVLPNIQIGGHSSAKKLG